MKTEETLHLITTVGVIHQSPPMPDKCKFQFTRCSVITNSVANKHAKKQK